MITSETSQEIKKVDISGILYNSYQGILMFRGQVKMVGRDTPVVLCNTIRTLIGVESEIVTFLDLLLMLQTSPAKRTLSEKEMKHFDEPEIKGPITQLNVIQAHTTRPLKPSKRLPVNIEEITSLLQSELTEKDRCPVHTKISILCLVIDRKIFCKLCKAEVGQTHFKDAHLLIMKPARELPEAVGTGESEDYWISTTGVVHTDILTVLKNILLSYEKYKCANAHISANATQTRFVKHLVLHLPNLRVGPRQVNIARPKSLERFLTIGLTQKTTSLDIEEHLQGVDIQDLKDYLHSIDKNTEIQEIGSYERAEMQKLANMQFRPFNIMNQIIEFLDQESPNFLNEVNQAVIQTAQCMAGTKSIPAPPTLLGPNNAKEETGITQTIGIITVGYKTLFPTLNKDLGAARVPGTLKHIPTGPVGIYNNDIVRHSSSNHLIALLEVHPRSLFVVEVSAYDKNSITPSASYLQRQMVIIKKIFDKSSFHYVPMVILSGPSKIFLKKVSLQTALLTHERAEKMAMLAAWEQGVILLPLAGIWMPVLNDKLQDTRRINVPILSSGKGTLTVEGAQLLADVIVRYAIQINKVYKK